MSSALSLGGRTEVAALLGVTTQRVDQLLQTVGFPSPVAELSSGKIWNLSEVEDWMSRRKGPGRPAGRLVGKRFRLADNIGSGGFADVFRAEDEANPGEIVAVKVLRGADEEELRRFRRELDILSGLDHPNIIPVLDHGVSRGQPWYAMPLAKGSLEDEMSDIPTLSDPLQFITAVTSQIGGALEYLHGREPAVFHRDLCPSNILRTSAGDWAISDFGLSREAERRSVTTSSATIFGWVMYVAPEQAAGLKYAGQPADIYSFGRVLLAMVLGRDPQIAESPPASSSLRQVIRKATNHDPQDRFRSAADLVQAVSSITDPVQPSPDDQELAEDLFNRLSEVSPDSRAVGDLKGAVLRTSDSVSDARRWLSMAMALLDADQLRSLWSDDPDDFIEMMKRWADDVSNRRYGFCDNLANFGRRVVNTIDDERLLELVIRGLAHLGANHNRWHVRDVLTDVLQQIQSEEEAVVALGALREVDEYSLQWNLTRFTVRSLQSALRSGIESIFLDLGVDMDEGS